MEVDIRAKPCTSSSTLLLLIVQIVLFDFFAIASESYVGNPFLFHIAVGGILTALHTAAVNWRRFLRKSADASFQSAQVLLPVFLIPVWLFLIS